MSAANAIKKFGFVILPRMYQGEALETLTSTFITHTDQTLHDLNQNIAISGEEFQVGSANGFDEVCLRSPGRYDVSTKFSDFRPDLLEPIEAINSSVLGEDHVSAFCGVVLSEPGSEAQQWHADSLHSNVHFVLLVFINLKQVKERVNHAKRVHGVVQWVVHHR